MSLPFDEALLRRVLRVLGPLRERYFRAEVTGLDRVPSGPAMIVGNHDGGYVAADGLCFGSSWYEQLGFDRRLYVMMHDFPFRIAPSMTAWLQGLGFLPASRQNADRVLDSGHNLVVFPGGAWEAFRPYRKRRQIDLGDRTGFVRMALRRRVPIVPMASVGAHETVFVLARGEWLARKLGKITRKLRSDVVPLWAGLPFGLGFGFLPSLPLPSKIKVELLDPVYLHEELGARAHADDPEVLRRGLELVRGRLQSALDRLYAERRWPILG